MLSDELAEWFRDRLLVQLDAEARRIDRAVSEGVLDAPRSATELIASTEAIRAAVAKLDTGDFGVCETCRGPIPFERLDAVPTARNCVACQSSAGRLIR